MINMLLGPTQLLFPQRGLHSDVQMASDSSGPMNGKGYFQGRNPRWSVLWFWHSVQQSAVKPVLFHRRFDDFLPSNGQPSKRIIIGTGGTNS